MAKATFTLLSVLAILASGPARAGLNPLQLAISRCDARAAGKLLEEGADAGAKDGQGQPVVGWLASSPRCDDASALATAQALARHDAAFQSPAGAKGPSLLTRIATRKLPATLAFLCQHGASADATPALRAIARRGDPDSVRALLDAGADPLAGEARSSALLDATLAGQSAAVAEMLKHVGDKQSAKVLAAFEAAGKSGNPKLAQLFADAGVRSAEPAPAAPKPDCQPRELTSAQRRLLARLGLPNGERLAGLAGGTECKLIQECGDLALIDCNSAADGPAYYLDQKAGKLLATCGGACMRGCTGCPPKEWACSCKF